MDHCEARLPHNGRMEENEAHDPRPELTSKRRSWLAGGVALLIGLAAAWGLVAIMTPGIADRIGIEPAGLDEASTTEWVRGAESPRAGITTAPAGRPAGPDTAFVHQADLRIEAPDVDLAAEAIRTEAEDQGGHASYYETGGHAENRHAELVLSVPETAVEPLMRRIRREWNVTHERTTSTPNQRPTRGPRVSDEVQAMLTLIEAHRRRLDQAGPAERQKALEAIAYLEERVDQAGGPSRQSGPQGIAMSTVTVHITVQGEVSRPPTTREVDLESDNAIRAADDAVANAQIIGAAGRIERETHNVRSNEVTIVITARASRTEQVAQILLQQSRYAQGGGLHLYPTLPGDPDVAVRATFRSAASAHAELHLRSSRVNQSADQMTELLEGLGGYVTSRATTREGSRHHERIGAIMPIADYGKVLQAGEDLGSWQDQQYDGGTRSTARTETGYVGVVMEITNRRGPPQWTYWTAGLISAAGLSAAVAIALTRRRQGTAT